MEAVPIPEEPSNGLLNFKRRCFCFPCWISGRASDDLTAPWERIRPSCPRSDGCAWWSRGINVLKKIREWSEIVAGPRWKTFIRRFNRSSGNGNARHGLFQYDPLSYALNFDGGPGQTDQFNEEDGYADFRDFSSRYASVSVHASK